MSPREGEHRIDRAQQLRLGGMTDEDIATVFGVQVEIVRRWWTLFDDLGTSLSTTGAPCHVRSSDSSENDRS